MQRLAPELQPHVVQCTTLPCEACMPYACNRDINHPMQLPMLLHAVATALQYAADGHAVQYVHWTPTHEILHVRVQTERSMEQSGPTYHHIIRVYASQSALKHTVLRDILQQVTSCTSHDLVVMAGEFNPDMDAHLKGSIATALKAQGFKCITNQHGSTVYESTIDALRVPDTRTSATTTPSTPFAAHI